MKPTLTSTHTYTQTHNEHTHLQTHPHAHKHAYTNADMHTCVHSHIFTLTYTHTFRHMSTHLHNERVHTHAHTHTHTLITISVGSGPGSHPRTPARGGGNKGWRWELRQEPLRQAWDGREWRRGLRHGVETQSCICHFPKRCSQLLRRPHSPPRAPRRAPTFPQGPPALAPSPWGTLLAKSHLYLYFSSGKCNSCSIRLDAFGLEVTSNPQSIFILFYILNI